MPGAAKSALSSSTVESAMLALMGQRRLLIAMLLLQVYVPFARDSDEGFGRRVETRPASARLNCSLATLALIGFVAPRASQLSLSNLLLPPTFSYSCVKLIRLSVNNLDIHNSGKELPFTIPI